eukprot:NODE_457_length_7221_cov_0.242207.p3 type:complete len:452 gc:universal NODE_457_length_7221_cov_0.242207:1407-52(-)
MLFVALLLFAVIDLSSDSDYDPLESSQSVRPGRSSGKKRARVLLSESESGDEETKPAKLSGKKRTIAALSEGESGDEEVQPAPKQPRLTDGGKYQARSIMELQGITHKSPFYRNQDQFVQVDGYVSQVTKLANWKGFFIQADPSSYSNLHQVRGMSAGIFINAPTAVVRKGDLVRVQGYVFEKYIAHYFDSERSGLTMTIVNMHQFNVLGNDKSKIMITNAFTESMPKDVAYVADPFTNAQQQINIYQTQMPILLELRKGMDYWESLEGMYVRLENPVVSQAFKYDGIHVYGKGMATNINSQGSLTIVKQDNGLFDVQPEQIQVYRKGTKRGSLGKFSVGDELKDIYGTIIYERGSYGLYVDGSVSLKRSSDYRQESLEKLKQGFRVASYNVLNLELSKEKQVRDIVQQIASKLKLPDVVGLVELVDDEGNPGESTGLLKEICRQLKGLGE